MKPFLPAHQYSAKWQFPDGIVLVFRRGSQSAVGDSRSSPSRCYDRVTGKTLRENLEDLKREGFFERTEGWLRNHKVNRNEVIRDARQTHLRGSIAILKGSRWLQKEQW